MRIAKAALVAVVPGLLLMAPSASNPETTAPALEKMRAAGDLAAERCHVWSLIAAITREINRRPLFESWHGEGELFSADVPSRPRTGIAGFARAGIANPESPDVPVMTYTLYNGAAFDHILRYKLNQAGALDELRKTGEADAVIAENRDVPSFPAESVVLKTVWWPVAKDRITALPVWDPDQNPQRRNGNPYTSWRRAVAVDPAGNSRAGSIAIDFAGSHFAEAHRVGLSAFNHVDVDAAMAKAMMADAETRKAVLIALGRPLEPGDHLILVAANLAAREIPDWIWATFWWHDRPGEGPFAAQRPPALAAPWQNYLMQTAFDAEKPLASDGGPHIAFDPWLEGRFPDAGHGGGGASNCMTCHLRASYPAVPFLPVTRGDPDLRRDRAFAPKRLRTSFLWSLAMHAKTQSEPRGNVRAP